MRRDFPPLGNGVDAPRLVVFKVINLKPLKGEVPFDADADADADTGHRLANNESTMQQASSQKMF